MGQFIFKGTEVKDLYLIEPQVLQDQRGYFMETFNERDFEQAGIKAKFVQDNESKSVRGVLRGLHFQSKFPQGKLVRVTKGEIYDVAVDLRVGSPTFGKAQGFILSSENKKQLYIPEGFAHGFLVLSEEVIFNYKCTAFYMPEYEGGVAWNDPELGIKWPIEEGIDPIMSEKDKRLITLRNFRSPFIYEEEIVTPEITLKPIGEKDIEVIREWRNNEVMQKTFVNTSFITQDKQLEWYQKYKEDVYDKMFIIILSDTPIGVISLYHIDYCKKSAEFGRLLIGEQRARGKNIGVKATKILCEYGFKRLGLRKIYLEVFEDNIYAVHVYEQVGFKKIGERVLDERVLMVMEIETEMEGEE